MNTTTLKKFVRLISIAILLISFNAYSQTYLPLTGGTMTGAIVGPAFNGGTVTGSAIVGNMVLQSGATVDLAPSGSLTGGTNSTGGSAIDRNFLANTTLNLTTNTNFIVDLGSAYNIAYISFGTYYNSDSRFIPAGFVVDYSTAGTSGPWTTIQNVSGNIPSSSTFTTTPYVVISPSVSARYIRLTINAVQSGQSTAVISGFQVISVFGGAIGNNLWAERYGNSNIFTNADVSIGTPTHATGYKFSVNGNAIATSMTVLPYTSWPDYVFKKDYSLLPLAKVKTFINQNHHLPEIPTEAQVAKNGQNLGEMNQLLLKKVEELTLYLLNYDTKTNNQNKKIDNQQQIIQSQQQEIDELKKQVSALINSTHKP